MRKTVCVATVTSLFLLCGCSGTIAEEKFTDEAQIQLKENAIEYTISQLQSHEAKLNTFVKISGTIQLSDSNGSLVKKGDRFKLVQGEDAVQVFNEQEQEFRIGNEVTVYGEYYGFVKGTVIDNMRSEKDV